MPIPPRLFPATLTLLGVLLAACSSPAQVPEFEADFVEDRKSWALPLNEFGLMPRDDLRQTIVDTLMATCLRPSGIPYPEPLIRPPSRPVFDIAQASANGYGAQREALLAEQSYEQQWLELVAAVGGRESDLDSSPEVTKCHIEVDEAVPPLPADGVATELTFVAVETATEDPQVVASAEAWRECMVAAGIFELTEWPLDMPTAEARERFGDLRRQLGNYDPDSWVLPISNEEIEFAMTDAKCREDFYEALYETLWNTQVKLMGEHAEQLDQQRAQLKEFDEALEQLLRDMG